MRTPHARAARAAVLALLVVVALVLGSSSDATAAQHHGTRHRHTASRASQVLKLVNRARSQARTCGSTSYAAVGPLKANPVLRTVAKTFARLMGEKDFFDHVAPDGTDPGDRITAAGYHWTSYGENIAAGYDTPKQVVAGWLASEGHCANIMTAFKDVGIGYANVRSSTYGTYWVMDFGTR